MRFRGGGLLIFFSVALCAALVPAVAGAATVVNGGFESGNLSGWQEQHTTEAGDWFAYRGTEPPLGSGREVGSVPAPPQGRFAAITDQRDPDALYLWQDVALEPGATHTLSLQAFYESQVPLVTPTPDTFSIESDVLAGQGNEQFRIDVMKPGAPLDSLNPEDILTTVFAAGAGSPKTLAPTRFSADLTPFAGQTVRIRAVVVNQLTQAQIEQKEQEHTNLLGVLNAGIDNVVITSAGPGIKPPGGSKNGSGSDRISIGRPRPNRKNGTVLLPVEVPGAGVLVAAATKKKPRLVLVAKKRLAGATTAKLLIRPTRAGRQILARKHKLRVGLTVTFDPDQGATERRAVPVVLKLRAPKHRARHNNRP